MQAESSENLHVKDCEEILQLYFQNGGMKNVQQLKSRNCTKRYDGYRRLYAQVVNITVRNGKDTDLKIDKDVFDIEFKLKAWR